MADWVDIANLGIRHLGEDRISSLTEDSERARAVNDVHETVRDLVLRKHPWNCALAQAVLAPAGAAPAFGFAYAYDFPTDPYCLRVLGLDYDRHGKAPWKSRARQIHTDEGTALYIHFIKRVADPAQFDATLVEALAAELAYRVAFRLTGSRSAEAAMKAWARDAILSARAADAQEGTPDDPEESDWLESRA
jgi:hypothetical protein